VTNNFDFPKIPTDKGTNPPMCETHIFSIYIPHIPHSTHSTFHTFYTFHIPKKFEILCGSHILFTFLKRVEKSRPRGFFSQFFFLLRTQTPPTFLRNNTMSARTPYNSPAKTRAVSPELAIGPDLLPDVQLTAVTPHPPPPAPEQVTVVQDSDDEETDFGDNDKDAAEVAAFNAAQRASGKRITVKRAATNAALGGVKDALKRVKADCGNDACRLCYKKNCPRVEWDAIESGEKKFSHSETREIVLRALDELLPYIGDWDDFGTAFDEEYPEDTHGGLETDLIGLHSMTKATFYHYMTTVARRRCAVYSAARNLIKPKYVWEILEDMKQ